jgi:TetR/AcrR family transcriptional regulator, regulator of cefoperazone and chloramphenicol sensitivity
MLKPQRKTSTAAARTPRQDGDATRQQLLDVAGQVFAERGFAETTSKEICARAGANLAAVNYHFGSREQLYEAVLVEAHNHLITLEDMQRVANTPADAREKLRMLLTGIVRRVVGPGAHWGPTVVIRELLAPTRHAATLVNKAIAPKAMVLVGIVAEIVKLPPTSPGLQRGLLFMIAPCLALLVAPRELRQNVFPALSRDPDSLADDLLTYAFAGLDALAARYREPAARQA